MRKKKNGTIAERLSGIEVELMTMRWANTDDKILLRVLYEIVKLSGSNRYGMIGGGRRVPTVDDMKEIHKLADKTINTMLEG